MSKRPPEDCKCQIGSARSAPLLPGYRNIVRAGECADVEQVKRELQDHGEGSHQASELSEVSLVDESNLSAKTRVDQGSATHRGLQEVVLWVPWFPRNRKICGVFKSALIPSFL